MNLSFRVARCAGFLAAFLLGTSVVTAGELTGGPPFIPGKAPAPMPAEWISRPVVHEKGSAAEGADLALSMDQQMYELLLPAVHDFAAQRKIKIAVQAGTCGNSAGSLLKKEVDLAGFCCPANDTDRLPGLVFHTLAITPIAIIRHPDNPVDNLTAAQVRSIFAGNLVRWNQLKDAAGNPGHNRPILPVARLHCKLRPGHWRLILDHEDLFSPELKEVGTIPDMVSAVASNPPSIGHISAWLANSHRKHGGVSLFTVDGVSPTDRDALAQGRYPFYKTFTITTWNDSPPHALALVAHLQESLTALDASHLLVPASRLRAEGWLFDGNELVGERQVSVMGIPPP